MWIKISSDRPFAISITSTSLRPSPPKTPKPPGAYPTTPLLDDPLLPTTLCNFASFGNNTVQYIAVPDGTGYGYTAEGQLPLSADGSKLQFSITPTMRVAFPVVVKTLDGNRWRVEVEGSMMIEKVMEINRRVIGHAVNQQRLFLGGRMLDLGKLYT